jgi:hypothetical protein
MTVQQQIDQYIATQPQPKGEELRALGRIILKVSPGAKLWFLDGRNSEGKVVSNPNIGYGSQVTRYANGETREFYRLGLSANTSGISVYVMGLDDKTYLAETYGKRLGKAGVTGYCVKFKRLADIDLDVFEELVADAMGRVAAPSV